MLRTWLPTQFRKTKDLLGNNLPPGTIRVRFVGSEEYAYPADPNRMPIPLYGEQVLCINMPAGASDSSAQNVWYYTAVVNAHGNVNNAILPFLQDKDLGGVDYGLDPIVKTSKGSVPKQLSFAEQDIVYIQPFQGDINFADRFGSILRFSSTHTKQDTSSYKKKPFWSGIRKGDPIVALTCGVEESRSGGSSNKYYAIEDPEKDPAFIYLTSSQKFNRFKLAQKNIGKKVKKLNAYDSPQVIIGSDRLVFNARKDEIVLVSKTDVKIATPKWQTGMDEFFTQMELFIKVCVDQAEGKLPYATPTGPTGPSSALPQLKKILTAIKQMKQ